MVLENITLQELVSFIGGFAGMLSLSILLIRYVFEKPKLKIIIEKTYYTPPHDSTYNFTTFYIKLRFENKGRRNTTVHSAELSFEYQGKSYSPILPSSIELVVIADDVKRADLNFLLQKNQYIIPEGTIRNSKLKISHIYGSEDIVIDEIKMN